MIYLQKANAIVNQVDLFAKPFSFFVGEKKSKSTFTGGIMSILIIAVSGIYFYYLMDMYFDNKIEPKITSSMSLQTYKQSITISENLFMFEMFMSGVPLKQYEKTVGKTFLTYSAYFEEFLSDGSVKTIEIPLVNCEHEDFKGLQCLDDSSVSERNIYIEAVTRASSNYALIINFCDPTIISNCASQKEIYQTVLKATNYFMIYTKIQNYSPNLRQYQDAYKQEYIYFDLNNFLFARISLIKASTKIKEGILIQSTEERDTVFDYQRIDTYFSMEDIVDRLSIFGFAYIVFEMNQVTNLIVIQHAMITEVLAQFMSIFNSLLTIGIIARMLAQTHIVEDMNNILLKEYYKKTALQLVDKFEIKKLKSQSQIQSHILEYKEQSSEIIKLQNKITESNFAHQKVKFFEMTTLQRLSLFFRQLIGKSSKKEQQNEGQHVKIYDQLLKQSIKRINIFEVYKDLIKIKMAIKLILSKEQFAALQFCGSQVNINHTVKDQDARYDFLKNAYDNDAQAQMLEDSKVGLKVFNQNKNVSSCLTQKQLKELEGTTHSKKSHFKKGTPQDNSYYLKDEVDENKVNFNQELEQFTVFEEKTKLSKNKNEKNNQKVEESILDELSKEQKDQSLYQINHSQKEEGSLQNINQKLYRSNRASQNQILAEDSQSDFSSRSFQMRLFHSTSRQSKRNEGDMQFIKPENTIPSEEDKSSHHQQQQEFNQIRNFNGSSLDLSQNQTQKLAIDHQNLYQQQIQQQQQLDQENLEEQTSQGKNIGSSKQINTNNTLSHLILMDIIEDNQEIQQLFLKKFIDQFKVDSSNNIISLVDEQIYESLIMNQPKSINLNVSKSQNISQIEPN